jgi:hypothetical protein
MEKEILEFNRQLKLLAASLRVREESMRVNAEFAPIEHAPEA